LVPCHTPSIEIALEHFRTLDVIWINDVVAVLVIKGSLVAGGIAIPGEVPIFRDISKVLGANAGPETNSVCEQPPGGDESTYASPAYVFQQASFNCKPKLKIVSLFVSLPPGHLNSALIRGDHQNIRIITKQPIPGIKTCKMRPHMTDTPSIVKVGKVDMIPNS
jgi:hypothetical protein